MIDVCSVALAMLHMINHALSQQNVIDLRLGWGGFGMTSFEKGAIVPELTCFLQPLRPEDQVPLLFRPVSERTLATMGFQQQNDRTGVDWPSATLQAEVDLPVNSAMLSKGGKRHEQTAQLPLSLTGFRKMP